MDFVLNLIFLSALAAFAIAFCNSFYRQHRLFRYMESAQPKLWQDAGCPKVRFGFLYVSAPMPKFLLRREYNHLPDQKLQDLGRSAYIGVFLAVAMFLTLVFAVMAVSAFGNSPSRP